MRPLLVIGATGEKCPPVVTEIIKPRLAQYFGDHVYYADDREAAFAMLDSFNIPPVVAYAPGTFGTANDGKLSPRIWTGEPQLVLTTAGHLDQYEGTDDPRQFVLVAAAVLRCHQIFPVESDTALEVLEDWLNAPVPELEAAT